MISMRLKSSKIYRERFDAAVSKISTFFGIPAVCMEIIKLFGGSDQTGQVVFGVVLILLYLLRSEVFA